MTNVQTTPVVTTLIIGAGFAGLGTAIRLQQEGIDDMVILERDEQVGGTWRGNQCPRSYCRLPHTL